MKIETYLGRGCSHETATRQVIDQALADASITDAELVFISVDTPEDARARRMLGSPTIRVNGIDVEYGDREPDETTTGCRYFNTPDGWKPVPHPGMIVRTINVARAREKKA